MKKSGGLASYDGGPEGRSPEPPAAAGGGVRVVGLRAARQRLAGAVATEVAGLVLQIGVAAGRQQGLGGVQGQEGGRPLVQAPRVVRRAAAAAVQAAWRRGKKK